MIMNTRPTLHEAMLRQSGRVRENAQALPRPARIRFSVRTTGVGETRLVDKQSLNFGAFMLEEPTFTWGVLAIDQLGAGQLPQCTAIVLSYHRNSNGSYTGADVAFKVDCAKARVRLKFSLTFEGSTLRSTLGGGVDTNPQTGNNYTGDDPADINVTLL